MLFNAKTKILSRQSRLTGKVNEMHIPLTAGEFLNGFMDYEDGIAVHRAFPTLNEEQRRFVDFGVTPEEYTKAKELQRAYREAFEMYRDAHGELTVVLSMVEFLI